MATGNPTRRRADRHGTGRTAPEGRDGRARREASGEPRLPRRGRAAPAGRSELVVAVVAAPSDLRPARLGRARLGHRRERVRRLPQRLRRHGHGSRAPEDRGSGAGAGGAGNAFRPADRGRADRRRSARGAVPAAVLALRQFGDRVHARRRSHHARADRAQADPEDRGDVPRSPRLADGVGVPAGERGGAARPSRVGPADARPARGVRRPGGRGARSTTRTPPSARSSSIRSRSPA